MQKSIFRIAEKLNESLEDRFNGNNPKAVAVNIERDFLIRTVF